MELTLNRKIETKNSTIGELFVNDKFQCYTLEDIERPVKVWGKTAIPKGRYEVVITYSAKFKKYLPLLLNVLDYKGIRIHAGNTAIDTDGCILVGRIKQTDKILESVKAINELLPILKSVEKKEKIFITIT